MRVRTGRPRFLPTFLESQLIPGSFEHALDILAGTEIDVSGLAKRFCSDETGAPPYESTGDSNVTDSAKLAT